MENKQHKKDINNPAEGSIDEKYISEEEREKGRGKDRSQGSEQLGDKPNFKNRDQDDQQARNNSFDKMKNQKKSS